MSELQEVIDYVHLRAQVAELSKALWILSSALEVVNPNDATLKASAQKTKSICDNIIGTTPPELFFSDVTA